METSTPAPGAAEHRATALRPHLVQLWRTNAPFEATARWLCEIGRARSALLLDAATGEALGRFPTLGGPTTAPPPARTSGPFVLRVALPGAGAVLLLERAPDDDPFDAAERRLFDELWRALDTAVAGARALEGLTLTPALVAALLDAMSEPAVLIHGDDVVYPNLAARTGRIALDRWLPEARRHPVDPGGATTLAIAVAQPAPAAPPAPAIAELPPWLRAVGELVEQGLSDKEIAEQTGKSVTTIKTAVQRMFRRLGIHSRHELIRRRWMRENAKDGGE
ncbi:LuxR C-terminal-related transcriptional regulator [Myxococcota bacterium]|nr:LuxR C-terminal-related transcriptional regulator [Myxococcota bacterium]